MDSSFVFEKYYNRALRYLSYRPRSEKEIREKLIRTRSRKKVEKVDKVIDQIINKLKEQNLLNDEEFARWWIEQRTVFRPKGIRLIRMELKQKGISDEMIEFPISNEVDMAKKLIQKRIDRYKSLPRQEIYTKLCQFLARRGFDFDVIKKSIDEVLSEGV